MDLVEISKKFVVYDFLSSFSFFNVSRLDDGIVISNCRERERERAI